MIQRVQTIFLAIVAICMGVVCATPIWSKFSSINNDKISLNALSLEHTLGEANKAGNSTPAFYILGFAILAGLIAIFSILQFKNRKLQMLLGAINSMVIAIVLGVIFYFVFQLGKPAFEPNIDGQYGPGFYAGGIALLANMIANRFIRRDENLVRSADRMR